MWLPHIRKNGHTQARKWAYPSWCTKYDCRAGGCYDTLVTQNVQRAERDALVMHLAQEHLFQCAMARITKISRNLVITTIKKVIAPLATTFIPLRERPILELDERWSDVGSKAKKVWIWLA